MWNQLNKVATKVANKLVETTLEVQPQFERFCEIQELKQQERAVISKMKADRKYNDKMYIKTGRRPIGHSE